jgi:hypothetical protein
MADKHAPSKPSNGVLSLVAFASVIAAAVSGVRLFGELEGWNVPVLGKNLFSTDAGGGGSLLGVANLVPIFGFWFGRRLASAGNGPSAIGKSLLLHVLGIAVAGGVIWASMEGGFFAGWKEKGLAFSIGTSVAGLFGLLAWPRAWGTNAFFGLLSRAPIALIQFVAIEKGWNTHYSKAHPSIPKDPDSTLFALTLAQATFWPLAFTTLVGGLFATIGAATVRRG